VCVVCGQVEVCASVVSVVCGQVEVFCECCVWSGREVCATD
jgi:hypothetical protein